MFYHCIAIDMKQLAVVIIVIINVLMDSTDGQYSNCNDSCPTGKYVIIACSTEGRELLYHIFRECQYW